MGRYWKLLGEYDAESTTYTEFAGGAGASPYTPKENAKLIGLRTLVAADAATTLTEGLAFRLTCDTFKPNAIECGAAAAGIRTAPAFPIAPTDFEVDQPVQAGVPVVLEGKNVTADTPVGVSATLWGLFQS